MLINMLLGAEVLQASGKGLTNSNSSNFLFTNFVIIFMLGPLRCVTGRGRRSVELFTSLLAQLGDIIITAIYIMIMKTLTKIIITHATISNEWRSVELFTGILDAQPGGIITKLSSSSRSSSTSPQWQIPPWLDFIRDDNGGTLSVTKSHH